MRPNDRTAYSGTMTMREARARYFEVNRFGTNGGYDEKWVEFKIASLPVPFPNSPGRLRAVRYHDLHHILTGYDTDLAGEFEISAWEVGAGCRDFVAAWVLNLSGMLGGFLTRPRRTFRAFVRGRRTQTLYGREFAPLLDLSVDEARRATHIDLPIGGARYGDWMLAAGAAIAGLMIGTLLLCLTVPLVPFGLYAGWRARRNANQAKSGSQAGIKTG